MDIGKKDDNDHFLSFRYCLLGVIIIYSIVIFMLSPIIGILIFVFSVVSFFVILKKETTKNTIESDGNKIISTIAVSDIGIPKNIPLPYAILNSGRRVMAFNTEFQRLFGDRNIFDAHISSLLTKYDEHINKQVVKVFDKDFEIYTSKMDVTQDKAGGIISICLVNVTEIENLKKTIQDNRTVAGLIYIDNYDEVMESIDDASVPMLTAIIDRKLNSVICEADGVLKKFEKDRYMFFMSAENLEELKKDKFYFLNDIREVNVGEHIPVTLSIGVGVAGLSISAAMKSARSAIDLALGRGGDQALIKEEEKYIFYGGKSSEVSHNARIRARVKAAALSELICEASEVFVMGHRNADLDSLGSAIGIYRIAKSIARNCYIVMEGIPEGVSKLVKRLDETDGYERMIISGAEAAELVTDKTLVIVVDTHIRGLVESTELLSMAKKIVVFDHHRKSTDFIENAVLVYHEPYASSTSELVAEMIQYIGEQVKLKPVEADAMLAGITMDTKNFCMKTGTITFEAAAFLRRNGGDSIRVRKLLQNDMSEFKAKARAVQNAQIFMKSICISACPADKGNTSLTAAQAADELLNIEGITASFVLCETEGIVYVSARSLGELNVQVILEKLGGGGHQTISGVQLKNISIDEAQSLVKNAIQEYLQEVD